jgi:hypothetical protein
VPGSRLHGGEHGGQRVIQREVRGDGPVPGRLEVGTQGGLHGHPTGLEQGLGDALHLGEVLLHVVAEEAGDDRVGATVGRRLGRHDGDRLWRDLGELGVGHVPEFVHPRQHLVAAFAGSLRVLDGVVVRRRLHQSGEHGRLGQREVGRVHAEVPLGGGLDAVGAAAEVHDVEVPGENLGLRVLLLEGQRHTRLPELPADALLGRGQPLLRGRRRLEQRLLDQLLGDGGAALHHRPRQHVAERGPRGALHVEAPVLVEA